MAPSSQWLAPVFLRNKSRELVLCQTHHTGMAPTSPSNCKMNDLSSIPQRRCSEIAEKCRAFMIDRDLPRVIAFGTVAPSVDQLKYFPGRLEDDLDTASGNAFRFVRLESIDPADADLIILTMHGNDRFQYLWDLRARMKNDALLCLWLWDNHIAHVNNLKSILAADLVFPSHWYAREYLFNPLSLVATHVPACSAQWTYGEARANMADQIEQPRQHRALVNYVDYPDAWIRSQTLRSFRDGLHNAEVLLMPPGDRSRYFSKGSRERFNEWASYKATVVVPMTSDLSTRVFDALLAGMILVVPRTIPDFDSVIPIEDQAHLGIVRIPDLSLSNVQIAVDEALCRFDALGIPGVEARHGYALGRHLLMNRVVSIAASIWAIGEGRMEPFFESGDINAGIKLRRGVPGA